MATLSFSEFVALLYPYCGNGATEAEFIVTITNKIMRGQPGRVNKADKYQNPMQNKSPRTLQAYFKGTRSISKRDASILYANSDTYKFEEHLHYQCSENRLPSLRADLEEELKQGPIDPSVDVISFCADLFVDILKDLSRGKPTEQKSMQHNA